MSKLIIFEEYSRDNRDMFVHVVPCLPATTDLCITAYVHTCGGAMFTHHNLTSLGCQILILRVRGPK
jgi:hypothetical protein